MASIGKMALSLATGVQETTLALANFNFDFAIIKMEALPEYHGLGSRLSKRRKLEAEEGGVHVTARQLGGLFADVIPPVPNLARVYGLRASEISANPVINPTGTASDGPWASHIGLDGTSIWAAATSGRSGVQVHLLACILARVWSNPEAVSVWSELVAARKAQLQELLKEDQFHMGHLMASRIEIGLEKLAEWDASARAWLSAADKAKFSQQKQLMLIIDNIDLQVRTFPRVYDSVMNVWTKSLTTMENLVSGVAQGIEIPEMLLGLTSWHLYPDMAVLGEETRHVIQKDNLVPPGGLVTIGMHGPRVRNESGITWTMPLAQMRYYGHPIHSTRSIGTKSLRISFDDVIHIAIGSAISTWGSYASDLENVCEFWITLTTQCESEYASAISLARSSLAWLRLFAKKATMFLHAKEAEKRDVIRLINLGRGRYRQFIGSPEDPMAPACGLADIHNLLPILRVEQQINFLRRLSADYDLGTDMRGAIISYRPYDSNHVEFTTLFPQRWVVSGSLQETHRRWIYRIRKSNNAITGADGAVDKDATIMRTIEIMKSTREPCGVLPDNTASEVSDHGIYLNWKPGVGNALNLSNLLEFCSRKGLAAAETQLFISGWKIGSSPHLHENKKFRMLLNSEGIVKVYVPITEWKLSAKFPLIPLNLVSEVIRSLPKNEDTLLKYFHIGKDNEARSPYMQSLVNLSKASLVYSRMPPATIDPGIASHPLFRAKWADYDPPTSTATEVSTNVEAARLGFGSPSEQHQPKPAPNPIIAGEELMPSRPAALALIVAFDSGQLHMDPRDFEDVIAISSGDSLYVSDSLLNDPVSTYESIHCLVGNVGKPGMALLLSPRDPVVKTPDAEWEMVNHNDFDGRWEDNFQSTSLHLKLTGYEMPINIGEHGSRYREVIYAEAVVSAHYRGQWVSDLNILSLYSQEAQVYGRNWLERRLLPPTCDHGEESKDDRSEFGLLTSIDNWPELLDHPPNTSVVRAKGNWDARLALSAVMHIRNDNVIIASGDVCWACVKALAGTLNFDLEQLLILS